MRMKLKNTKNLFKYRKIRVIVFLIILISFIFLRITTNLTLYFLNYAEAQLIKLTTTVINTSVSKETMQKLDTSQLYDITKNNSNEIEMVDYNSNMVNAFLDNITNEIQKNIIALENGNFSVEEDSSKTDGTLFYIPLGVITNNPIFNNLGPKIPVKMRVVGSLLTNINVKIKEYGINNALIEMTVFIQIKEKVILPMLSKEIQIENEIPVSYKLINGKIPNYYGSGGLNKSSNIYSLPLE